MKRRMINALITESDSFYFLNAKTKLLYFYLILNADDDGFVNNARSVASRLRCRSSDIKCLVDTGFLFDFGDGVVVIRHWLLHNTIRKDKYSPTINSDYAAAIYITPGSLYTLNGSEEGCVPLRSGKIAHQLPSSSLPDRLMISDAAKQQTLRMLESYSRL